MIKIREALRGWLRGDMGLRRIADSVGADRKTVRRLIEAAVAAGLVRNADEGQLTDELLGAVVETARPDRPRGHGQAWQACAAERDRIKGWLDKGLTLTKARDLLGRRGVMVAYRTLRRFAAAELGYRRQQSTVRVADCEPGAELQVDFGRLGMINDGGRRRALWALIPTAVLCRHMFVWLTLRQTLADVIGGLKAVWELFGGVFAVVIYENVPRNIFVVLWPTSLCAHRRPLSVTMGVSGSVLMIAGT